jgi:NADH:ubiquinone oxidoreductase subunit 2 (subunit N)
MGFYLYAALGILASVASLYYYLGPVVRMYFRDPARAAAGPAFGWVSRALVVLMAAGAFYFGLRPSYLKVFPQTISIIIAPEKQGPYVEKFR